MQLWKFYLKKQMDSEDASVLKNSTKKNRNVRKRCMEWSFRDYEVDTVGTIWRNRVLIPSIPIVSRDSYKPSTFAHVQTTEVQPTLTDVPIYFKYMFYNQRCLCAAFLWHLRLGWLLILDLYKECYLLIFNVGPFDYTAFMITQRVGIL